MSEETEARVQGKVFQWHWNNFPEERQRFYLIHNNPKNKIDGARLKAQGLVAGVSDMAYICKDGRTVYIEFKLPGESQRPAQVTFQKQCESVGTRYELVYSVEQGIALLEDLIENGSGREQRNDATL